MTEGRPLFWADCNWDRLNDIYTCRYVIFVVNQKLNIYVVILQSQQMSDITLQPTDQSPCQSPLQASLAPDLVVKRHSAHCQTSNVSNSGGGLRPSEEYNELLIENVQKCKEILAKIKNSFNGDDLQNIIDKIYAIQNVCTGDGCGLTSGSISDMYISEYFQAKLGTDYTSFHKGESDMKLYGYPLSLKKIKGGTSIALNWSKNPNKSTREYFQDDIIMLNTNSGQWWKKKLPESHISYCDTIMAGMYIIPKNYCKRNITLSSNNKTDTRINKRELYKMLHYSISQNLYLEFPPPNKNIKFDILRAFT